MRVRSSYAWFAGYQPTLAAITWIGYDTPKKLGDRETGGGLSLPVWIEYMAFALKNVPVTEPSAPEGVVNTNGEWFYTEYAAGTGVSALGMNHNGDADQPQVIELPPADEKKRILDLFKN